MTPIEFSRRYKFEQQIVDGSYFSPDPIEVEEGDVIGVLLLNLGGPHTAADIEPFLYNLFMDPAIIDIPLKGYPRHLLSRLISRMRAKKVAHDYRQIDAGGGSPINHLTEQQSEALESELNNKFKSKGVTFRTFVAMRYWHPFSEEAEEQIRQAGVTKLVLLPLYPQYSKTTTGASLVYWKVLQDTGIVSNRPTTYVQEYATHPSYLAALSSRIDEGLTRFPKDVRHTVHLLFSAHGTPIKELVERHDPYCCLIHSTVWQLLAYRKQKLQSSVAFQSKVGPATWLQPSTPKHIEDLANSGVQNLLVIPIAFVTDHVETVYELGIEIRDQALESGIKQYEVTNGLNNHPDFITALVEAAASQITLDHRPLLAGSKPHSQRPKHSPNDRKLRCVECKDICEAYRWGD